jgi:hypothetical protein
MILKGSLFLNNFCANKVMAASPDNTHVCDLLWRLSAGGGLKKRKIKQNIMLRL